MTSERNLRTALRSGAGAAAAVTGSSVVAHFAPLTRASDVAEREFAGQGSARSYVSPNLRNCAIVFPPRTGDHGGRRHADEHRHHGGPVRRIHVNRRETIMQTRTDI